MDSQPSKITFHANAFPGSKVWYTINSGEEQKREEKCFAFQKGWLAESTPSSESTVFADFFEFISLTVSEKYIELFQS